MWADLFLLSYWAWMYATASVKALGPAGGAGRGQVRRGEPRSGGLGPGASR